MKMPIYWVTPRLAGGPFPMDRGHELAKAGITHVINVSATDPKHYGKTDGLEIVWRPINDLEVIPREAALACVDDLHRILATPRSRVYVHCLAGQHRSPTIVWLYLISRGYTRDEAGQMIGKSWKDAVPGHPRLVDEELIEAARKHSRRRPRS